MFLRVLTIVFVALVFETSSYSDTLPEKVVKAVVVKVADGDTITVRARNNVELKIRMVSIDTPETHFMGKSQGPAAEAAAEMLAKVLPIGSQVAIERAKESRDQYGRTLGYVWAQIDGHVVNTNLWMVKNCWAVNYLIGPNLQYIHEFQKGAFDCIRARKGIFDPALGLKMLPYDFRNMVRGSKPSKYIGDIRTKLFYPPGDEKRVDVPFRTFFLTQKSAVEAGFQKSSN